MESVVGNIVKAEKGQRVGSYAKINQKCKDTVCSFEIYFLRKLISTIRSLYAYMCNN